MSPNTRTDDRRRWHQALAYAVAGRRLPELGEQDDPQVRVLAEQLRTVLQDDLNRHVHATVAAGQPWPHPVPADLMAGLGRAQFTAALGELRVTLHLNGPARVATGRSSAARPTAAEQRLLDEVPPHHGSA